MKDIIAELERMKKDISERFDSLKTDIEQDLGEIDEQIESLKKLQTSSQKQSD
ncbi:hypothetical protein [Bacillus sp. CBEL-1]|uniref:hypothetical protein n=1 Tax=Bacillus sp. CBEL-1 TaxID=2502980 RepID=UPI001404644A|nr:hypothetical protein [Bacillus sp. CBEL-1]